MTGLSLAQEIMASYPESEIIFFATSKPFEKRCILEKGFIFKRLKYTTALKGSVFQRLRFLAGILADAVYSGIVINRFKPNIIVGLGGYSSAPPVIAAAILLYPFVLVDQNLIPGRVNRLFSRWSQEIYCHFQESIKWFGRAKSVIATGNPVRKEILGAKKEEAARFLGLSLEKKTILIMGGSQGAAIINKIMINCLSAFEKSSNSLQIVHCTGDHDFEEVKRVYEQYKIDAYLCPFMSRMEFAYSMADIIVSRAGAGTISEITAIGLPAILIPYPFAADNHQYYNALELAKNGAAYLIEQRDFTVDAAVKLITDLLTDEKRRKGMGMKSKGLGKPEAANLILKNMEELIIKKIIMSNMQ